MGRLLALGAALVTTAGVAVGAPAAEAAVAAPSISLHLNGSSMNEASRSAGYGTVHNLPSGATVVLQQFQSGAWGAAGVVHRSGVKFTATSVVEKIGTVALRSAVLRHGKTLAVSAIQHVHVFGWVPLSTTKPFWKVEDVTVNSALYSDSIVDTVTDLFGKGTADVLYIKTNGACRTLRFTAAGSPWAWAGTGEAPATTGVTLSVLVPGQQPVDASVEPGQAIPVTASLHAAKTWALQVVGHARNSNDLSSEAVFGTPGIYCDTPQPLG